MTNLKYGHELRQDNQSQSVYHHARDHDVGGSARLFIFPQLFTLCFNTSLLRTRARGGSDIGCHKNYRLVRASFFNEASALNIATKDLKPRSSELHSAICSGGSADSRVSQRQLTRWPRQFAAQEFYLLVVEPITALRLGHATPNSLFRLLNVTVSPLHYLEIPVTSLQRQRLPRPLPSIFCSQQATMVDTEASAAFALLPS